MVFVLVSLCCYCRSYILFSNSLNCFSFFVLLHFLIILSVDHGVSPLSKVLVSLCCYINQTRPLHLFNNVLVSLCCYISILIILQKFSWFQFLCVVTGTRDFTEKLSQCFSFFVLLHLQNHAVLELNFVFQFLCVVTSCLTLKRSKDTNGFSFFVLLQVKTFFISFFVFGFQFLCVVTMMINCQAIGMIEVLVSLCCYTLRHNLQVLFSCFSFFVLLLLTQTTQNSIVVWSVLVSLCCYMR